MMGADFIYSVLQFMAVLFVFVLGVLVLAVIILYIIDITQKKHAIRRNYPVIGHFRYFFEHLGQFFRQYFYAMDREELPFNRAERSWVYRAAKNLNNTTAFGTTRDLRAFGAITFVNSQFPEPEVEVAEAQCIQIGQYCRQPYEPKSFFNISGMSYGAISKPAVLALSKGAHLAGCWLNTGEGAATPYHFSGGADLVMQIGTAKYGMRNADGSLNEEALRKLAAHPQIKMFEIKISQGAKPGKGGILPAKKVTEEVSRIRGIPVGVASISPCRHPEIDNVAHMLDFIKRVRDIAGKPVGIKTVMGSYDWLTELCREIHHRGEASAPDFITIDSADGGTGAAPMSLMDYMGLTIAESLPTSVEILKDHELLGRIRVIASGKLITPAHVAWALAMGADFVVTARGAMFALGCIQALQCNKNTCPTGITTHDPRLQKGLDPEAKAIRVQHYFCNTMHEVAVIAHSCGVKDVRDLNDSHILTVSESGLSVPIKKLYNLKMH